MFDYVLSFSVNVVMKSQIFKFYYLSQRFIVILKLIFVVKFVSYTVILLHIC